ncbi:MAG: hypothetical protein GEU86_19995 [Actinophytocola sp.]|nr:hypothetical protein [Actinophytocola sp.]
MPRRLLATLSVTVAAFVSVSISPASAGLDARAPAAPLTLAVIGDTPYGPEQVASFPQLIDDINRDPRVREVVHLGDIKNGSSLCTDEYFDHVFSEFNRFLDPVIYTPGDNEWTDCHRANNGAYDPLERLDAIRSVFFGEPGSAHGVRPMSLDTQANDPAHATFAENTRWVESQTVVAAVHAVGSNNGLAPWFGGAETAEQTERRLAEVEARTEAALAWVDGAFDVAEERGLRGVVISMQADTFIGGGNSGFAEIVRRLADRSRAFDGDVLLLQGDSHRYLVDKPLADGHAGYGISEPVPNLTRIVIEGETTSEWLRVTVDPRAEQLFRWQRVHPR